MTENIIVITSKDWVSHNAWPFCCRQHAVMMMMMVTSRFNFAAALVLKNC